MCHMTSKCDREAVEQVAHEQDAYKQIEDHQQERPHKGAGPDMHYMASTDKKTSAQAAPAFSSSVTGVSLQEKESVRAFTCSFLLKYIFTTINGVTFQPGRFSYRQ